MSGGSKITYTVGRAVELAALEARERLLEVAAEELEIAPEDLEIVDGAVRPVGVPAKAMAIERARAEGAHVRQPVPAGRGTRPGRRCRRPRSPRPTCRTCASIATPARSPCSGT